MRSARIYLAIAWHELRAGLRTSLVPLMFAGLVGYLFVMMTSAETLRGMGGAGVERNSPLLVFLMTSGQSFWLIFAWAWVFAQVVTRDRQASLHELVLSMPVSLRGLLFARYAGALAVAILLGTSSAVGLLLAPVLSAVGALPSEAIGPTPYVAIFWAWLLFVVPSAAGLGALYLAAALRTRSTAGPFVASAIVILLWMIAMVVLRDGGVHTDLATLMDATGFGEAEAQTKHWTPQQKSSALLALTPAMIENRLVWTALPLALLAKVIGGQTREALVLERSTRPRKRAARRPRKSIAVAASPMLAEPSWLLATLAEARFCLARTMTGWSFAIAAALWVLINVGGAVYHLIGHAEGPFVPRAELLAPFMVKLCYVFSVFAVAGFVGTLARKDQQPGFAEMLDATPAPLFVRVVGRALAALALTVVVAVLPTLSVWIVVAVSAPSTFEPYHALLTNLLVAAPALLEIAALTFLVHALVRSAGTAYALSMLVAFIAIVNHEAGIVSYPPAQIGIPVRVQLSELIGWSPWLAMVFEMTGLKLGGATLAIALGWSFTPRGMTDRTFERWREALRRLRGAAGLVAAVAAAAVVVCTVRLHERLVVRGGYLSTADAKADDAAREARFWREASPFSVEGGEVTATIAVVERAANVTWKLRGVRSEGQRLHGNVRTGMRVKSARVDGVSREVVSEHDVFAVDLKGCAPRGCDVDLEIRVQAPTWTPDGEAPWFTDAGVWARASDLLPALGHDRERALRAPDLRRRFGLSEQPEALDAHAYVPALAVAPAGSWRWSVSFTELWSGTPVAGSTDGGLDFAVVSGSRELRWREERRSDVSAWHGPTHAQTAREILDDVTRMSDCLRARLGGVPEVVSVVQAPRDRGALRLHGQTLWVPEDRGWDVGPSGTGRLKRRSAIAEALAARWFADRAALRDAPGARWLVDGVAGWLGLECVRAADDDEAWLALLERGAERIADGLGALEAPLSGVADDGAADWARAYTPHATSAWAQGVGHTEALRIATLVADGVRAGRSLRAALAETVGERDAEALLGRPWATDVSVHADAKAGLEIRGERFLWDDRGWRSVSHSFDVIQRFTGDVAPPRQLQIPAHPGERAAFVVFDAAPSFERSPSDNVFRGTE